MYYFVTLGNIEILKTGGKNTRIEKRNLKCFLLGWGYSIFFPWKQWEKMSSENRTCVCVCMCVCVCICICVYVCVHIYIYILGKSENNAKLFPKDVCTSLNW